MKPADIKRGAIYQGRCGTVRKVLAIKGPGPRPAARRVRYDHLTGDARTCGLAAFARWAAERLDDGPCGVAGHTEADLCGGSGPGSTRWCGACAREARRA